jgi:GGDEF domain-containing protein
VLIVTSPGVRRARLAHVAVIGATVVADDEELDAALTRADLAMLAAKRRGRGRLETAADPWLL